MKMPRLFVVSGAIVISLATIFIASRQSAQDRPTANSQNQEIQTANDFQPAEDPPTIIKAGKISPEQRRRSKGFRLNEEQRTPFRKNTGNVTTVIGEPWEDISNEVPMDMITYVGNMACSSDLIVMGKVIEKTSQLTEDEKTIFTDYKINIEEIYRSRTPKVFHVGHVMTVTRSGGAVDLEGRILKVYNKSYKLLRVGITYVLFLKYENDADAFVPSDRDGTFRTDLGEFIPHNDVPPRYVSKKITTETFRNIINGHALQCSR